MLAKFEGFFNLNTIVESNLQRFPLKNDVTKNK
jgi:hypothetical protein